MRKCPVCGKLYILRPYHVYRQQQKATGKFVCSWKCARVGVVETERVHKLLITENSNSCRFDGGSKCKILIKKECENCKFKKTITDNSY